jgi:hypothetical protein
MPLLGPSLSEKRLNLRRLQVYHMPGSASFAASCTDGKKMYVFGSRWNNPLYGFTTRVRPTMRYFSLENPALGFFLNVRSNGTSIRTENRR